MGEPREEEQRLLRAMDANSNRVSEGMRVLEEVVRFVLDDRHLTERLKEMRHLVRERTLQMSGSLSNLLGSRDSNGDVGRELSTRDSLERQSASGLVAANMKRAQEGLRVLEELSASLDRESSTLFKELRFELYSMEKEIVAKLHH
ncbi:MAG: thiamine-phosphate pyrophosphorylase [Candidatus Eiseniibacteriota bacterium]|nr:MAG: thiamine-phosphate pyrophosphorylase [Candidatus Eisenbacteria bacterium]